MAKIDLARRAQIGRDRRARTRQQLIDAARALFTDYPVEAVTVDEVVDAAGLAKGTFYVHFDSLADLQTAVADSLASEFDELLQPRRLILSDPVERVAAGCLAFIAEARRKPAWGLLVARGAASMPNFAGATRERIGEDLRRAAATGRLGEVAPDLGLEVVAGIVLRTMQAIGEGRLFNAEPAEVVAAILRAIGVASRDARRIAGRVAEQAHEQPTAPQA